ncbi:hypothetical protein MSI_24910 [Treponema sp. JC4]|uniref:hypothetical protein n=1 Tax=Treponema sp. JC4 TaxID=1124982 RepID=UPI00025AFDD3|nr:hypothetical protein [Treponema sp. JC4]EID84069.1 hypothetical protein MSI_24910 [Treponema sp. JC4]
MEVCQYEAQIETAIKEPKAEAIVLTDDGMHLTAFWARLLCGCGTDGRFEPIYVMENIIPLFDSSFNYEIVEANAWNRNEFLQAYYNPEENNIVIRSDVYERALAGVALDVITIAHEVVHCIQSIVMRFLNAMQCVEFKTALCSNDSYEMQQHELQTDKITALVLSPDRLIEGKTDDEILQQYFINPLIQFVCGLVKAAGKNLMEALNDTNYFMQEVEKCAV